MGNKISSATPQAATAGINSYVSELGDIQYEKSLGSARFLKTIRGRHRDGLVVVKIFVKPEPGLSLRRYMLQVGREHRALIQIPNAYTYQRFLETEKAAYLVRQYFYSSLYDRISIRPFLNIIEKKWITYQLLVAVADSHAQGVYHGDIKTENVQVTTWNWVFLTDYASFKPTYLPEDNPADFSFFFDTSDRRSCYVAPERFYKPGSDIDEKMSKLEWGESAGDLTSAMDVFSLGCVIAELFLEGTPIFSLSQLLKYRNGEYDPSVHIDKIEEVDIRLMVKSMIHLDAEHRHSADEYLTSCRGTAFPEYFYSFMHQYISGLTDPHEGLRKSNDVAQELQEIINQPRALELSTGFSLSNTPRMSEADEKMARLYADFAQIADGLKLKDGNGNTPTMPRQSSALSRTNTSDGADSSDKPGSSTSDGGVVLIVAYICSMIRNTVYPSARVQAIDMLLTFAEYVPDDVKLDRLIPYLVVLLNDDVAYVRSRAVQGLTELLGTVNAISPINARIFPEYILPNLETFTRDSEVLVRVTYANCISLLAQEALRFLDMAQLLKMDGNVPNGNVGDGEDQGYEASYDTSLHDLQNAIQEQVKALLIDPMSAVKRALMSNVTSLCVFFGRQKANDVLLSHMITYLNDRDWMLRSAFFESIVGVGTFVGGQSLELYILPLMIQSLTDAEEFVVEKVLHSLTSLAQLGLFQRMKIWELVAILAPLMCHPNIWIRYGVVAFTVTSIRSLPLADVWCVIYPIIKEFLRADVAEITEETILESLKSPLPRQIYEQALIWANKANAKSLFWRVDKDRKATNGDTKFGKRALIGGPGALIRRNSLLLNFEGEKAAFSDEDLQYFERLRGMGMTEDDEDKLVAMREYIFKSAKIKQSARVRASEDQAAVAHGSINLKDVGVTPHTVFLTPTYTNDNLEVAIEGLNLTEGEWSKFPSRSNAASPFQIPDTPSAKSIPRVSSDSKLVERTLSPSTPAAVSNKPKPIRLGKLVAEIGPLDIPKQPDTDNDLPSTVSQPSSPGALDLNPHQRVLRKSKSKALISTSASHEQTKAAAEISTNNSYATGQIDQQRRLHLNNGDSKATSPSVEDNQSQSEIERNNEKLIAPRPVEVIRDIKYVSTTYDGRDANLKELLEKKALEAFPGPMPELGPKLSSIARRRRLTAGNSTPQFRTLQSWKPEGTLVAHLAEHKASITRICLAPDHSFFASCSDDGSVKIWDCARLERNVTNRSRLTYQKQGGRIKCMTFIENTHSIASASDNGSIHIFRVEFKPVSTIPKYDNGNLTAESHSMLLVATTGSNIYAIDIRTMSIAWQMKNKSSFGVITAMVADRRHTWLLIGTSRGILTLFDLRFHLPLRTWVHPSKSRISRLVLHPSPVGRGRWVLISTGRNEVSVWDVERLECSEIYAVRSNDSRAFVHALQQYKATDPPTDNEILQAAFTATETNLSDSSIRAIMCPADCHYLITAGTDRKIRYWDYQNVENSSVVLGQEPEDPKQRYVFHKGESIVARIETTAVTTTSKRSSSRSGSSAAAGNTLIQQRMLLHNHLDAINDLQITEVPYPMLISGDRDGVIKVLT